MGLFILTKKIGRGRGIKYTHDVNIVDLFNASSTSNFVFSKHCVYNRHCQRIDIIYFFGVKLTVLELEKCADAGTISLHFSNSSIVKHLKKMILSIQKLTVSKK